MRSEGDIGRSIYTQIYTVQCTLVSTLELRVYMCTCTICTLVKVPRVGYMGNSTTGTLAIVPLVNGL